MTESSLSQSAKEILRELQTGENIAEPSVYPGSLAFSEHARLYLENAENLSGAATTDFAVFGVLYCIRHGLELWLKCFLRNFHIDQFLSGVAHQPEIKLGELIQSLKADGLHSKADGISAGSIRDVISIMRKVLEDEESFPECRKGSKWADKGLDYLRENRELPRQRFASLWTGCGLRSHDLVTLWDAGAGREINDFYSQARSFPNEFFENMTPRDRIRGVCDFFAHYDQEGEAFRYPLSNDQDWHFDLPSLSLDALAALASEFAQSVTAFQTLRRELYTIATIGNPRPQ